MEGDGMEIEMRVAINDWDGWTFTLSSHEVAGGASMKQV